MIKAIETEWKGYRFRSRLEARWAVFFEHMGWGWKYEHQGYEIGWSERRGWLPDFEIVIPGDFGLDVHCYVEVKGDKQFLADGKFADALDFNGGPPNFAEFHDLWSRTLRLFEGQARPIMLLGEIPYYETGVVFVPMLCWQKGISLLWCAVLPREVVTKEARLLFQAFFDGEQQVCNIQSGGVEDWQPKIARTPKGVTVIRSALDAARQARFEHGEKPKLRMP